MNGSLLFRDMLQSFKKEQKMSKIQWDNKIPGDLADQWMDYFQMLAGLKDVKFSRSYKPERTATDVDPELCTFNNGNPNAMGTASYIRWKIQDGSFQCRLMISKGRLGHLDHLG